MLLRAEAAGVAIDLEDVAPQLLTPVDADPVTGCPLSLVSRSITRLAPEKNGVMNGRYALTSKFTMPAIVNPHSRLVGHSG